MTISAEPQTTLSLVHLRRPAARVDGRRPPLLLLMHGVGSNERSMLGVANAVDESVEVLLVRSPIALGAASYAWFHVQFTAQGPVINADEARAGWEQIARFIDEAVAAYNADGSRVYVGGFSQGGIMSLAALLTAPSRIAGALCLSGRLLPQVLPFVTNPAALANKPVLVLHGMSDNTLAVAYAHDAQKKLSALGVAVTYDEFPMGHEVTSESLAVTVEWLRAQVQR